MTDDRQPSLSNDPLRNLELAVDAASLAVEIGRTKGRAIGAPGDYGYSSPTAKALYELALLSSAVQAQVKLMRDAMRALRIDQWIELASLGEPDRSTWPWDGGLVLIHCRSIIPNEPGVTGQGRFACRPGHGWDWWLVGTDTLRDPPVRGICGPVTHVRRIVPPVDG